MNFFKIITSALGLLSARASVSVINPIPDQFVQIGQTFSYNMNNVFSGLYSIIGAVETGENSLPSWLTLNYEQVSSFPSGYDGLVTDIELSPIFPNLVFVADNDAGLNSLDMTDPLNPKSIYVWDSDSPHDIATSGNNVFLRTDTGMSIVDVTNLTAPQKLGTFLADKSSGAFGIIAQENYVFVPGTSGLYILNVSNPMNPTQIGLFPSGSIMDIAFLQQTIFLACGTGSSGILGIDIKNVTDPKLTVSYPMTGAASARGISFFKGIMFVAAGDAGLQAWNVSDSTQPLYTYPTGDHAGSILINSRIGILYLAQGDANVAVFDINNIMNPIQIGNFYPTGGGYAVNFAALNTSLLVADQDGGVQIGDVTTASLMGIPLSSEVISGQKFSITVMALDPNGNWVNNTFTLTLDYSALQLAGQAVPTVQSLFPNQFLELPFLTSDLFTGSPDFLRLSLSLSSDTTQIPNGFDLSLTPSSFSIYPVGVSDFVNDVALSASAQIAYIADLQGVQVLDVSDPTSPKLLTIYQPTYTFYRVRVSGNLLFLGGSTDFQVVNASIPTNLKLLGSCAIDSSTFFDMGVSNNLVGIVHLEGVFVVDVSNPALPILRSSYLTAAHDNPRTVAVYSPFMFVGDYYHGLKIYDLTHLNNPILVGTLNPAPNGMARTCGIDVSEDGNAVFLANQDEGLVIIDVTNRTYPTIASELNNNGNIGVRIAGNTAFMLSRDAGTSIVDVTDLSQPTLLGKYAVGTAVTGIAVSENNAFLASEVGMQAIDLRVWTLTIQPVLSQVGNYNMNLKARDEVGRSVLYPFMVRVEGPPVLSQAIPIQSAEVNQAFYYAVPEMTFSDPNEDTLSYNVSALPSWLSFDARSGAFFGTPSPNDVGYYSVVLGAIDPLVGLAAQGQLNIVVLYPPTVAHLIPGPLNLVWNRYFNYSIPPETFDGHGQKLSYAVLSFDDSPAPSWINISSDEGTLFGKALGLGSINLWIIAKNTRQQSVSTPFSIIISPNSPPQVVQFISVQTAEVGQQFNFFIPINTFEDANGDTLYYSATLVDGSSLPNWLHFDADSGKFEGVPGTSDTNFYSARSLSISLIAQDTEEGASAQTVFTINVIGTSSGELAVKIITPIFSILGMVFGLFKNRATLFNRTDCNRRIKRSVNIEVEKNLKIKLDTPRMNVRTVEVNTFKSGAPKNHCVRFFCTPYHPLPGGEIIPRWMQYDQANRVVHANQVPKEIEDSPDQYVIFAKDRQGIIVEEIMLNLMRGAPRNSHLIEDADNTTSVEMAQTEAFNR